MSFQNLFSSLVLNHSKEFSVSELTADIDTQQQKRIAVIGGGWSGLYALKISREDGHDAVLFEKENDIGGVWRYKENAVGGIWRNGYAVSSKTYLHASDFPLPDETPLFPHHSDILAYLKSYASHFNLWDHICLNHTVLSTQKENGRWQVKTKSAQTITNSLFDAVIIAPGQAQIPSYPCEDFYKQFAGFTMHSSEYKQPTSDFKNKNVLIVGGGESACDIANDISPIANRVYLSMRQGRWFQPKYVGARLALDTRNPRKARIIMKSAPMRKLYVKIYEATSTLTLGAGGHGLKEWLPSYSLLNGTVIKSREVLDKIATGRVIPQKGVVDIQGNLIWFADQKEPIQVDMIIFATGFRQELPYLQGYNVSKNYKLVFNVDDPTLAFVGTARPVFGSIPALAELQARWISSVLLGQSKLPSKQHMEHEIAEDNKKHKKTFPIDHNRIPNLVDHFEYADYLIKQIHAEPDYLRMFLKNYQKWRILMSVPWTPFESRLKDPIKGHAAFQNIKRVYYDKKQANTGLSLSKALPFIFFTVLASLFFAIQAIIRLSIYIYRSGNTTRS